MCVKAKLSMLSAANPHTSVITNSRLSGVKPGGVMRVEEVLGCGVLYDDDDALGGGLVGTVVPLGCG